MMGFFPDFYPDELIYSIIARYWIYSGYSRFRQIYSDLYERKEDCQSFRFINHMNENAKMVLAKGGSFENIVHKHTLVDYYIRFLPIERRKKTMEYLMKNNINDFVQSIRTNVKRTDYVRYCPLCAMQERELYGETYWHRAHQYYGVSVCHIHGCRLLNTAFPLRIKSSRIITTAEEMIPCNKKYEIGFSDCEREFALAKYVFELMTKELDMNNSVPIGEYMNRRMEYTEYHSLRGQNLDVVKISNDISSYYAGMNLNAFKRFQLKQVFQNKRFNFTEICAVAMFLGISVDEINNLVMPEKQQFQMFEHNIELLRKIGLGKTYISRILNINENAVAFSIRNTNERARGLKSK